MRVERPVRDGAVMRRGDAVKFLMEMRFEEVEDSEVAASRCGEETPEGNSEPSCAVDGFSI